MAEKDKKGWDEEAWGPMEFREFDKCPVCGCPNRYSLEALRGHLSEAEITNKPPVLGLLEHVQDTALYRIRLRALVDSCCQCGAVITLARSKAKIPLTMVPKGKG